MQIHTLKTLAACSLVAITLSACAPNNEGDPTDTANSDWSQEDLAEDTGSDEQIEDTNDEQIEDTDDEQIEDIEEPVTEILEGRPSMSVVVYDNDSYNPISDYCLGQLQEVEVVDGIFDAEMACTLNQYDTSYGLDFEGALGEDGLAYGTVTLSLNGRTETVDFTSSLVGTKLRLHWQGTWDYVSAVSIDYSGNMDLQ